MLNDIVFCFTKRHVTPWIWCWTSKWNLSNIYTSAHYTWEPLTTLYDFVPVLGRPLNTSSGSCHFPGHCSHTCMRDSRSSSSARTRREQEIHRNSIWLGAQSHMTSQYIWQPPRDHTTWFCECLGTASEVFSGLLLTWTRLSAFPLRAS